MASSRAHIHARTLSSLAYFLFFQIEKVPNKITAHGLTLAGQTTALGIWSSLKQCHPMSSMGAHSSSFKMTNQSLKDLEIFYGNFLNFSFFRANGTLGPGSEVGNRAKSKGVAKKKAKWGLPPPHAQPPARHAVNSLRSPHCFNPVTHKRNLAARRLD